MVGAGMIGFELRRATNIHWQALLVGKAERAALKQQKPAIVSFTGLSGAGKSTIANLVDQQLCAAGRDEFAPLKANAHLPLLPGNSMEAQ